MIKLRIGVKPLFQESIASFKNPIPFLSSDSSSLKKNRHGQIIEVIPKYLKDITTIDNKDIETKLSKVKSIKQNLTNISSSFFNYEDITTEKASIAAVSESLSNYNSSTALSKYKSDFKQFKKVMPLLTCTVPCNGSVIAASNLNEEQYLRLSNDDVKVIVQDICKHKCKYLEMMNLIPAQQPKVDERNAVNERKVNSFYDINDINAHEDVTQQLGNFKLFNDNNMNRRNAPRSERSVVFPQQQQQQQLQYMNERNNMKLPKTFEMDPYSQQSKANMSMYNYNIQHHQQQKQVKPKMMMVDPYANNSNNNNDNSFVQRQQQQQRLPYTNIQQQLNQTQAPYQTYSHNQQERIDFNKFKQNLFFPHEQHARANSNISSSYNEFRRIINNINISDTEISKYLNEYTNNVIIAAERYFQSKYNTPELTLQYIYSQTFRKTHTFSFLARVDELFSQVSMDMPNLSHYKLLFQNGMEITKEMAASFKCIGALDIKNNSLIYVQPL